MTLDERMGWLVDEARIDLVASDLGIPSAAVLGYLLRLHDWLGRVGDGTLCAPHGAAVAEAACGYATDRAGGRVPDDTMRLVVSCLRHRVLVETDHGLRWGR